MEYLLIVFIVAVVLSPLAWLRTSPAQKRVTALRKHARSLGLQVQLVPEVEAAESDTRPAAVRYFLPFADGDVSPGGAVDTSWTLLREHRRGWESPWQGWTWFRGEAAEPWYPHIERCLRQLPPMVYGVRVEKGGVAAYLRETGDEKAVEQLLAALQGLMGRQA